MPRFPAILRHLTISASLFWLSLLPVVVALGVSAMISPDQEATFRYAGLALQLLGLVLVAVAIKDTLHTFKQPSLIHQAAVWFETLYSLIRWKPILGAGQGTIPFGGTAMGSVRATGTLSSSPTTVEQRLTAIEAYMQDLRTKLNAAEESLAQRIRTVEGSLASEAHAWKAAEERLHALLKSQAVEGIHWEVVGLVWLLFGTLLAGIPGELAWVF